MLLTTREKATIAHCGTKKPQRGGYVLIAVLIMIVVLSLLAYRFTDAMTAEYRGATRTADMTKLRAAAVSGIMYAGSSLADPNTFTQMGGSAPFANPSIFNNQSYFGDQIVFTDDKNPDKNIMFSVVSVVPATPPNYYQQYGVIDEGGKININALALLDPTGKTLYNVLLQLPNMAQNQQTAANIVAYVLAANAPSLSGNSSAGGSNSSSNNNSSSAPIGANSSYYQGLSIPYYAKNGPLNTLDELLLVEGVTPQFLYGNDQNMSGLSNTSSSAGQNSSGFVDRGWQDYLTVNGREFNVNSKGTMRIDVNADSDGSGGSIAGIYSALQNSTIDQTLVTYMMGAKLYGTLPAGAAVMTTSTTTKTINVVGKGGTGTTTITMVTATRAPTGTISQLESAINAKLQGTNPPKGQPISSLLSLANTEVSFQVGSGKDAQTFVVPSPLTTATMNQFLPNLLDQATTSSQVDMIPRVNLSTASPQVITALLLAMPNFTQSDVDSVISAQNSLVPGDPANLSGAWLVTTGGLSTAKFTALSKYVTGTSMLYRVQAVGYYAGTTKSGSNSASWPMARVEALIDTNMGYTRIVYIRDLTSLDSPRAFTLPLQQTQP